MLFLLYNCIIVALLYICFVHVLCNITYLLSCRFCVRYNYIQLCHSDAQSYTYNLISHTSMHSCITLQRHHSDFMDNQELENWPFRSYVGDIVVFPDMYAYGFVRLL